MLDVLIGGITLAIGIFVLVKGGFRLGEGFALESRPARNAGLILAAAPLLGALLAAFLFMISGQRFLAPISRCSIAGLLGALIFTIMRSGRNPPGRP